MAAPTSGPPASAPRRPGGAMPRDGRRTVRTRRRRTYGKRLLALLALAAVGVALAEGVVVALQSTRLTAAQRQARAAAAERRAAAARKAAMLAALQPAFAVAMQQRARFFVGERRFVNATFDANAELSSYASRLQVAQARDRRAGARAKACAQPHARVACRRAARAGEPLAPDLTADIASLRVAAGRLHSVSERVAAVVPQPALTVFYAQLALAAGQLRADARYDADTLARAVVAPDPNIPGDAGRVNATLIATLHPESALPAIRLMNRQAVHVIHLLGADIRQYDVPGGTGGDPGDHSTSA
jgi:hypothetical protein